MEEKKIFVENFKTKTFFNSVDFKFVVNFFCKISNF